MPPAQELWHDAGGDLDRARRDIKERSGELAVSDGEPGPAIGRRRRARCDRGSRSSLTGARPTPRSLKGRTREIYQQLGQVAMLIQRRIELFCALPFDKLDLLKLEALTRDSGRVT